MKKLFLLSMLTLCATASAQDIQQYVSVKGSVVFMKNDLSGSATYTNQKSLVNNLDKDDNDTVGGFRLSYGLVFPISQHQIRSEIEYGYNGNTKLDDDIFYKIAANNNQGYLGDNVNASSKIKSQFVVANFYYDFINNSKFTPYINAGIGYARLKAENSFSYKTTGSSFSDTSNNFAWNLGVGAAYNINNNIALDAGYRYTDYGKVKTSKEISLSNQQYNHKIDTSSKIKSHEMNIGIRYTF